MTSLIEKWKSYVYTCIINLDYGNIHALTYARSRSPMVTTKSDGLFTQKSDVGLHVHVIHLFYPVIATSLLKSFLSIQNQQQPNIDNEEIEEWQ